MTKIERTEGRANVYSPYNADFVFDLKERLSDRKWNRDDKCWNIDERDIPVAEDLLHVHFGYVADNTNTVSIIVEAVRDLWGARDSVRISGTPVARAWGRDSGARSCENVTLLSGSISSGGSVKNWGTYINEGSRFRIDNFSESSIETIDKNKWKIIEVIPPKNKKAKLQAKKEELLKRLSEIETELNSIKE